MDVRKSFTFAVVAALLIALAGARKCYIVGQEPSTTAPATIAPSSGPTPTPSSTPSGSTDSTASVAPTLSPVSTTPSSGCSGDLSAKIAEGIATLNGFQSEINGATSTIEASAASLLQEYKDLSEEITPALDAVLTNLALDPAGPPSVFARAAVVTLLDAVDATITAQTSTVGTSVISITGALSSDVQRLIDSFNALQSAAQSGTADPDALCAAYNELNAIVTALGPQLSSSLESITSGFTDYYDVIITDLKAFLNGIIASLKADDVNLARLIEITTEMTVAATATNAYSDAAITALPADSASFAAQFTSQVDDLVAQINGITGGL